MTLLSTIDSEAFYQRVCASNADCVNNRFLSKHCPPIILREPKLLGLRGLARASIYDVRKIFGFFYPPCHCHKSADFVLFVSFLETPSSPHSMRMS